MLKLAFILITAPSLALACKPDLGNQFRVPIHLERPDQALLNEAVLRLVNSERCNKRLTLLKTSKSLISAAANHSQDMATKNYFSHQSPTRGFRTLKNRLKKAGASYRQAAENIAQRNVYAFEGQRFQIKNAASCHFVNINTKKRVPAQTYASLAADAMRGWMASKGHRRNILNGKLTHIGTGIAIDRDKPYCGDILLTQVFTGG